MIFLDTGFLFALLSARDEHHARVVEVFRTLQGTRLSDVLLTRIHWATQAEEQTAFDSFKRHQDKDHSLVDCLSFVVMEKVGITEALAVDSDFTQRFIARPGPKR